MVKRRKSDADSDSDDNYSRSTSPASKRARTEDNEDERQYVDTIARAVEEGDEHADGRRNARKKRHIGRVARAGVIQSLELINYMCHQHLTMDFNPQVNFVIGRNGSGKSAVFSALQIALGAHTHSTGRGSKASELIRYGSNSAQVILTIRNKGPEAFKPDLFGPEIVIKRKISRNGSSTWSMNNSAGKVVSQAKAMLREMCDHMAIDIESPLTVLTQDNAKTFIGNSSPQQKYQFFLNGTQLQQLVDEYDLVQANIRKIGAAILVKTEVMPSLEQATREARVKYNEATKAQVQANRLEVLKKEKAWYYVASKTEDVENGRTKVADLDKKILKAREEVARTTAEADAIDLRSIEQQTALTAEKDGDAARAEEHETLQNEIKLNKRRIAEFENDRTTIDEQVKNINKNIGQLESRLATETKRLAADGRVDRVQLLEQLEEVRRLLKTKKEEFDNKSIEVDALRADFSRLSGEESRAKADVAGRESEINSNKELQRSLQNAGRSPFSIYGRNIERVLQEIGNREWATSVKPLGPLGYYVTLCDATYRELFQLLLGRLMVSFVVAHPADRKFLAEILGRHGNPEIPIVINQPDIFDYSSGVPPNPNVVTPLHVLEFRDEWVKRVFINANKIERVGLARDRVEAQALAEADRGRPYFSATQCQRVLAFFDGGFDNTRVEGGGDNGGKNWRHLQFQSNGKDDRLRMANERGTQLEHRLQVAERTLKDIQSRMREANDSVARLDAERDKLRADIRSATRKQENLEELSKEDAPVEIQHLQDQIGDLEREKGTLISQFDLIETDLQGAIADNRPKIERQRVLRQQNENRTQDRRKKAAAIDKLQDESMKLRKDAEHYEKQVVSYQGQLTKAKEDLEVTEEELTLWTSKALTITDGVIMNDPRDLETISREIDAVTKVLKQVERRHGASAAEVEEELRRTEKALSDSKVRLESMTLLNEKLKECLATRMGRWHEFRSSIATQAKGNFFQRESSVAQSLANNLLTFSSVDLAMRGMKGTLVFKHDKGTLDIKIEDGKTQAGKPTKYRELKSLSGGEKSYSQLCMLLAFWESIGCPIRCLDEFDVFMDQVNRRVSTEALILAATRANNRQHIFISPQDIDTIVPPGGPVTIHQMKPPKR